MIPDKLVHHFPDAQWNMTSENYESLEWFGPGDKPTESEINALPEPPPPAAPVTTVTRRQGKQQLVIAGLDDQVATAIDGIADTTERKLTRIWYDDAETWGRDNPQLLALATALGLTDQQVDDLFQAASQL